MQEYISPLLAVRLTCKQFAPYPNEHFPPPCVLFVHILFTFPSLDKRILLWYNYTTQRNQRMLRYHVEVIFLMREEYMRFGEYIKKKRLDDPRELTLNNISKIIGISLTYLSDIEAGRKKPFDAKSIERFCDYLELSSKEKARIYDLAAKEKNAVPADIEDVLMYEPIGEYARFALRQSNAGNASEADWKKFIRDIEAKKLQKKGTIDNG